MRKEKRKNKKEKLNFEITVEFGDLFFSFLFFEFFKKKFMEKRCSIFRIDHFLCFLFFDLNLDVFNNIFNKTLFQKSEKTKPYNIF